MDRFSVKETFEIEINKIWSEEKFKDIEFLNRGYAIQDEISLNSILFIGINPAYQINSPNQSSHFYNVELEGLVYPYFRKFQDISKRTGIKWTHIDLLFIRETNQKNIERLAKNSISSEFIQKQMDISQFIIEKAKPKIIVVSNSYARELLYRRFQVKFDNSIGTHRIVENIELENTPIFFTSMLTGQRALDLGSYERLIWHINYINAKK